MIYIQSLDNLKVGEKAKVKALFIGGSMRQRLQDIGLIETTKVECVQKSPSGDPKAYMIRGACIALRDSDASKVIVENNDE